MAEIRFFLKVIDKKLMSTVISDAIWMSAKEQLADVYHDSNCLPVCKKMISDFETISHVKYRTDLDEFIKESQYEDFYGDDKEEVLVSTIHKAKGHEFDTVYMLVDGISANNDEGRRKIYVGLTRAKRELYIHYNNRSVPTIFTAGCGSFGRYTELSGPKEIILPLTHGDVVLNYFKGKKELIFQLHSGAPLWIESDYLSAQLEGRTIRVLKFS